MMFTEYYEYALSLSDNELNQIIVLHLLLWFMIAIFIVACLCL